MPWISGRYVVAVSVVVGAGVKKVLDFNVSSITGARVVSAALLDCAAGKVLSSPHSSPTAKRIDQERTQAKR